jgi:peptidylprolyl isomerase
VIDGMDAVDKIKPGEPPANPDKIVKMQVAADADDASKTAATNVLQAQQ